MNRTTVAIVVLGLSVPVVAAPRRDRAAPAPALQPQDLQGMTLEEMQAEGERAVQYMNATARDVLDAMAMARKSNDFAKMNCIGTALTSIKGLLRISDQNSLTLREKVIARDRAGAEHEFVKMQIARQKVAELLGRARACGGPSGDTIFEGEAQVDRDFESDLPKEDVRTALHDTGVFPSEPPPSASPFY